MDSANALELLVAADKLGIAAVATQCCRVIDQCPLERVLEITSQASDVGLDNRALLDAKVGQSSCICVGRNDVTESRQKGKGSPYSIIEGSGADPDSWQSR